jgi:RimJ/RimL family protein N-acetyltransferase
VASPQVELTPFGRADFRRLIGWIDSPEVLARWGGSAFSFPLDEEQLERDLAGAGDSRLAFNAMAAGEVVGHVGLAALRPEQGSAYIGRFLVEPGHRGQGLGGAILHAILGKAFRELGLHRVGAQVLESNPRAVILYERVGFVREGVLRDALPIGDGYVNLVVVSLLEHEHRPGRGTG